ncbi:MAG: hypothetical protein PVF58_22800 [Candidatus Methanofastidiosia archaeon]|jgi:hypothetical protein
MARSDGKMVIQKRISMYKIRKKIKEYQTFVLKDTFPEYVQKEYLDDIKKIIQKNGESNTEFLK